MPAAEDVRFLPCLIDRLTDLAPDQRQEAPLARTASIAQIRAAVRRDLDRLLNCHHRLAADEREAWPAAGGSTVDFGTTDLTGRHLADQDMAGIAEEIKAAIVAFEPRLDPASVTVSVGRPAVGSAVAAAGRNGYVVEIAAVLRVATMREELLFRSLLDTESGHYRLEA